MQLDPSQAKSRFKQAMPILIVLALGLALGAAILRKTATPAVDEHGHEAPAQAA